MGKVETTDVAAELRRYGSSMVSDVNAATFALYEGVHAREGTLKGARGEFDLRYGSDPRHEIDLYLPAQPSGAPCLLFAHGGGFIRGGKKLSENSAFYGNVGVWAASLGFVGAVMSYRLAPEHVWPSGSEDVQRAIEWLQIATQERGFGASRIIVMGHSAGACHVAHYLADQASRKLTPPIRGAILISGVYEIDAFQPESDSFLIYYGSDRKKWRERSNLDGLLATNVPLLMAAAQYDPDGFHVQLRQAKERGSTAARQFVEVAGHTHISGVAHIGTSDRSFSDLLWSFCERAVA